MGNCFQWIKNDDKENNNINKLSILYPNAEELPEMKDLHKNDNLFFYLPELPNIDLQINNLDSIVVNEDHIEMGNKIFSRLTQLQGEVKNWNSQIERLGTELETEHLLTKSMPISEFIPQLSSSSSVLLILEIQQGLLVHHDFYKKISVSKTYAIIELFKEDLINKRRIILKRWQTEESEQDIYSPKWKQVLLYTFKDKIDFDISHINITYQYDMWKNSFTQQQIGEVQTFKTSSFRDQEIYQKEILFKDPIAKGILAKMIVRFQVIHDIDTLKNKKNNELENRKDKVDIFRKQNYSLDPKNILQSNAKKSRAGSQIQNNSIYLKGSNNSSLYFEENKFFFNNA